MTDIRVTAQDVAPPQDAAVQSATAVFAGEKLAAYMQAKGLHYIVADLARCNSCGGDVCEVFARVGRDTEGQRLIAQSEALAGTTLAVNQYSEKANHARVRVYDCCAEDGTPLLVGGQPVQLLVTHRLIRVRPPVRLNMRRMLGIVDVTARGLEF
ncbi:MAG: hypothetical protein IKD70_06170 [Eggerthellaceae bacterium]|nr:hypothetical protein [Eggerthellaceae bacterium]